MTDKNKEKQYKFLNRSYSILGTVLLLIIGTFFPANPSNILAATGVPSIISYQGRLTDSSGNLLGGSGTNYFFKFSIWDSPTVGSGSKLWPAGSPGTTSSNVTDGVFNVNIGDTANGYPDTLSYNFNTNNTVFLQVEVSSDGVTFETLSPRQQITSSGYAINANTLGGFTASQSATGNQIPVLNSGNLTLGGTNPQLTASGSNALVLQGSSTGDVQFFSATNKITSSGNLTIGGTLTVGSFPADPGGLPSGTIFYNSTSNKFKIVENGVTKTLCNLTDAGCGAGGGSTAWSSIIDPASSLALSMGSNTTNFTYGNSTGSSNLFNLSDSVGNTGTGTLVTLTTASGSALNPFKVTAAGVNALFVSSGGLVGLGTTTPQSKLSVVGSAGSANPITISSSTGTSLLTLSPAGNLTITGNVSAANISGTNTGDVTLSGENYLSVVGQAITANSVNLGTTNVSGVLPSSKGGTGTTTLGNLTVGAGLSVTGGQAVLIGTSTSISLGSAVITSIATGTTGNIFNISTSTNSLTLNLPFASISATGQLQAADWTTFNNKLSGSLSANQVLYATAASSTAGSNNFTFNSSTNVLTVTNASTSAATVSGPLFVTGQSTLTTASSTALSISGNLFVNATSTLATTSATRLTFTNASGTALTLAGNINAANVSGTNTGDVTLAGQNYLSISGQQITANLVNLASHVSGVLPVSNGGIGTTTLGNLSLGAGLAFTSGDGKQIIVGTSTTIGLGSNVVTSIVNDTNITGSISGNALTFVWSGQLSPARGGTGTSTVATSNGQLLGWNNSTYGPTTLVAGSNITINTTTPGQITITGSGSTGLTTFAGMTGPVITFATGTAGNIFNFSTSSNTITLNLPFSTNGVTGQLQGTDWVTFNNKLSGSLTNGFVVRATGASTTASGILADNGTVAGVNATSSTVTFNVQGNAGTSNPFNVASSTGTSLFLVGPNGSTTIASLGTGVVRSTSAGALFIGQVTNTDLQNSSLTVTAGTGLSGGGSVSLGGSVTLSLPNVGTNGTYGNASTTLTITTDAQGRVSGVSTSTIAIDASSIVSGLLGVPRGGTGAGSFTANGIIYGNATGALQATAAGTAFQVLRSNGSASAPSYSDIASLLTQGSNIVISGTSTIAVSTTPTFSTINVTGQTTLTTASSTALTVSGQSYLTTASSTGLTVAGNLYVTGTSTLASTTATALTAVTLNGNTITAGTGTLTLGANTLTVSGSSNINQDLRTTASPTFNALTLTNALAVSNGGIGTTTLGSLSLGAGLSFTSGDGKLSIIGTSTTISLGSSVVTSVATGTTGNIFNASIAANTLTLNLPFSTNGVTGQLQGTDWVTFNNKLSGSGTANYLTKFTGASTTGLSLLFDNGSSLGINSTSPTAILTVQGSSTLATTPVFTVASSNNSSLLTVLANGNVGVGVSAPATTLQVNGSISAAATGYGFAGASGASKGFFASGSNDVSLVSGNGGSISFGNFSNQNAYGIILSTGNFALGTTTAQARLSVTGTSSIDPFDISSTSGSSLLRVVSSGNVGIGTSSPSQLLTVGANNQFTVSSIGNVNIATLTASSLVVTDANKNLASSNININSIISNVSTGTTGNIFNISTSTNSLTLNLPFASISATGQLQAADWTTFNNKLSGSLSANQVLYATAASSTAGSNNFTFNSSTNVLTVTNASTSAATVSGPLFVTGQSTLTTASTTALTVSGSLNVNGQSNLNTATTSALTVAGTTYHLGQTILTTASGTALTLTGQAYLTTASATALTLSGNAYLSTILSGTWNGSVIAPSFGGTGTSTVATSNGQLLGWNNSTYGPTTLVAGSNITINTTTPGQITITGAAGAGNYFTQNGNAIYNNVGYQVGVNSTTPTANLVVQGSSTNPTLNIFTVASSSNAVFFTIASNGSTTLSSLSSTLPVRSTSAGSLYNGSINLGSSDVTGLLAVSNGGIGTTTLGSLSLGAGLSFTSGDGKLSIIGTSTTISLGSSVVTSVATGTTGNIFNASIAANTLTLNLPFSTNGVTGQLQGTDWVTFNNKLSGSLTNGFVVRATGASTTASGILADNGTVAGVNATSSTVNFLVQGTGTNNAFQVNSSTGTSLLTVLANGNVGVGSTSPNSKLVVIGSSVINGALTVANVSGATNLALGSDLTGAADVTTLRFGRDTDLGSNYIQSYGANTAAGRKLFIGGYSASFASTTGVLATFDPAGGNVGIGTTNPTSLLFVQQTSTSSTSGILNVTSSTGASLLYVANNGNVGIGTATPSQLLNIYAATGNGRIVVESANGAADTELQIKSAGALKGSFGYDATSGDIKVSYGSQAGNGLVVNSSGYVGIGTTVPATFLTVNGNNSLGQLLLTNTGSTSNRAGFGIAGSSNQIVAGDVAGDLSFWSQGKINFSANAGTTNQLTLLTNGNVGIGTSTASGKLALNGGNFNHYAGTPVIRGTIDDDTYLNSMYRMVAKGRYVYTSDFNGSHGLNIVDVSNPDFPKLVSSVNSATNFPNSLGLAVSGNYAYVGQLGSGVDFTVVDVRNPSNPVVVGTIVNDLTNLGNRVEDISVQGKYAYVVTNNSTASQGNFAIIDISNPSNPRVVSSIDDDTNLVNSSIVKVSGKFAYVVNSGATGSQPQFAIIDISNPLAPVITGTINSNAKLNTANGLDIQGRYAYIADNNSSTTIAQMAIVDISSSTAPTVVGSISDTVNLASNSYIKVRGKYAYTEGNGGDIVVVDISSSTAPSVVTRISDSNNLSATYPFEVSGKYLYAGQYSSTAGKSNFTVLDLSGVDTPTANIGDLAVGSLNVSQLANVDNLSVSSGLQVGQGGIISGGPVSIQGSGTTSLAALSVVNSAGTGLLTVLDNGNVGIGTSSPLQLLSIAGNMRLTGALFDSNNASGTLGMVLQSTGIGQQWVATSTLGITGGSGVTGGTNGKVAVFTSATTLGTGDLLDNLTVSGVNATSSTVNFLIQGTGANTPFQVNSSSGTSLLTVLASGNVGIGTTAPTSTLFVQGAAGSNNPFNVASSNGTSLLLVAPGGNVTSAADLIPGNGFVTAGGSNLLTLRGNVPSGSSGARVNIYSNSTISGTSGNQGTLSVGNLSSGFLPTSGTATYYTMQLNDLINQTNTANGITRGIFLKPTLTSAYDYRNFETQLGQVATLSTSTILSVAYNTLLNPIQYTSASSSLYNLANASTLNIAGAPIGTTASTTIASSTGITIQGNALTNVTNGYGLYVSAPSGATNNYAALFNGTVSVGSSTPGSLFTVQGTSGATTPIFSVASSSNASYLTVLANGNVGVGTVTPASLLDVNGTAQLRGSSNGIGLYVNSSAVGINTTTAPNVGGGLYVSKTSSAAGVTIESNSLTADAFDINKQGTTVANIQYTGQVQAWVGSQGAPGLSFVGDTGTGLYILGGAGNHNLAFSTNGTYKGGFTSAGNFAIGNQNPQGLLDVGVNMSGTPSASVGAYISQSQYTFTDSGTASGSTASGMTFNSIAQPILAAINASTTYTNVYGLYLGGAPTISGSIKTVVNSTALNIAGGAVSASTTNAYGLQVNAPTGATNNIAAVFSGGNVGIGTSSPLQLLSIAGNMRLTGALFDSNNASGTLGMVLQSTGIGQQWVATSTLGITGGSGVTGGTNGKVAVFTSATTLGTGDLLDNLTVSGVNATSSTVNFNIQGTGALNPFNVASSSGNSILTVMSNGSVLIGTSTFSSSFTANQTALGIQGNVAGYYETNIQNRSASSLASTDYVTTADNGNANSYYADFGINSSGFARTSAISGGAGDAYLYNSDRALYIGTASSTNSNANINFVVQNTNIATATLSNFVFGGNVGVGTTSPVANFAVNGTGLFTGHTAFGNTSALDQGSNPEVLNVNETYNNNGLNGILSGVNINLVDNLTANNAGTDVYGVRSNITTQGSFNKNDLFGGSFTANAANNGNAYFIGGIQVTAQNSLTGTGQATFLTGASLSVSNSGTTTNQTGIEINNNNFNQTTNLYGIHVNSPGLYGSTVSNIYGIKIEDHTGATNNYALVTGLGNVGFGTFTPTSNVVIQGTAGATKALFTVASSSGVSSLTVASSGNVGIGTTSPTQALQVVGSIANVLTTKSTMTKVATVGASSGGPLGIFASGNYVYVTNQASSTLSVIDVSNPLSPVLIATTTTPNSPYGIYVSGKYAYVGAAGGTSNLAVYDISNPKAPTKISAITAGDRIQAVYVSGRYLYGIGLFGQKLHVVDIGNPYAPVEVGLSAALGANPNGVYVSGHYAYISNGSGQAVQVVDVANPSAPNLVATLNVAPQDPDGIFVSGRYAYTPNVSNGTMGIIDISNPLSPTVVSTTTVGVNYGSILVSGRYAYLADGTNNLISVVDISNAASPKVLQTVAVGTAPGIMALSGRYLYVANGLSNDVSVVDVSGTETNGLVAASAQFGNLQVSNDILANGQLQVFGGLQAAAGGIFGGPVAISIPTSTSAAVFSITASSSIPNIFTVLGNGTIGIGTSSPIYQLDIVNSVSGIDPKLSLTNNNGSTGDGSAIDFNFQSINHGSYPAVRIAGYGDPTYGMNFGKLGIYVDANNIPGSPTYSFDYFQFTAPAISTQILSGLQSLTITPNLTATNTVTDDLTINRRTTGTPGSGIGSSILFMSQGSNTVSYNVGRLSVITTNTTAAAENSVMTFSTANSGSVNESMRIDSTGNVGIGTTSPSALLSVQGTSSSPTLDLFRVASSSQALLFNVTANGRVGISDISPDASFETVKNGTLDLLMLSTTANTDGDLLVVKNNGSVGIGSSAPGSTLVVQGTSTQPTIPLFVVASSSKQSILQILSSNGTIFNQDASSTNSSTTVAASVPVLQLGSTILASPNASGTYFGINAPSSFGGNFFDIQKNGVSQITIGNNGSIVSTQAASVLGSITLGSNNTIFTNGTQVSLYGNYASSGGSNEALGVNFLNINYTSGSGNGTQTNHLFGPTSGTGIFNSFVIGDTINQTGNSSGITRGVYINPTVTAAYDYRNFESSSTKITLTASSTISTAYNFLLNPFTYTSASSSLYNLANASTLNIAGAPKGTSASTTIASSSALTIQGVALTNVTNGYGLYVSAPTGATANYAAIFNGNVGIGTSSPTQALQVVGSVSNVLTSGTSFSSIASATVGAGPVSIYVSGKYAYVANAASSTVSVVDITNPLSPVQIATTSVDANPQGIYVSGRYAYTINKGANNFSIIDISNPSAPTQISTTTVPAGIGLSSIYVSGKYLYTTDLADVVSFDISNPYFPKKVGQAGASGVSGSSLAFSGRYAYFVSGSTGQLSIYDLVNPVGAYSSIGSITITGMGGTSPMQTTSVSGRYAYIIGTASSTFNIIDISKPTAPSFVASTTITGTPIAVAVSGRYAYVALQGTSKIAIVDVSNPSAPTLIGTSSGATTASPPTGLFVSGRYVYTANGSSFSSPAGSTINVFDISGTEVTSLIAHSAEVGSLQVRNDAIISGQLQVSSGLNVGIGGILSDGALAVVSTTTTSYFGGKLGIGTSTPTATFHIQGTTGGLVNPFVISSSTGSSMFTVLPTGNVGIGSVNPSAALLSLQGTTTNNDLVDVASSTGASVLRVTAAQTVGIGTTSPSATFAIQGISTNPTLNLFNIASSSGQSLFTVTSSGNIGIGTTTPLAYLHIASSSQPSIRIDSYGSGTGQTGELRFMTAGNANYQALKASSTGASNLTFTLPGTAGGAGQCLLTDASNQLYFGACAAGSGSASGANGLVQFATGGGFASDAAFLWDSTNHRLGINTTSPIATLAVQGSSTAPTLDVFRAASSSGATFLTVTASGNVGIGTTAPGTTLSVAGNTSVFAPNAFTVQNASGANTVLYVDTVNNRVGIGTATPTSALQINNSSTGTLMSIASTSGSTLFEVRNIGTNFGSAAYAGAFVSKTSYFGEEYSQFRSTNITVSSAGQNGTAQVRGQGSGVLTANTASQGTMTANGFISATPGNCTFSTVNTLGGVEEIISSSTLATAATCMETMSTNASNTLLNMFNAANLPVVEIKASSTAVNSAGTAMTNMASTTVFFGIGSSVVASATPPLNGIGFTNCMNLTCTATSTNWIGMVIAAGTVSTTSCPSITLAKFALLRFEVIASNQVNFYVANNLSNGPYETACGTVTATLPATNMTVMLENSSSGVFKVASDIDYFRSWQDDAVDTGLVADAASAQQTSQSIAPDLATYAALSQRYPGSIDLPVGTLVSWNTSTSTGAVLPSSKLYDSNIIGVVVPDGAVSVNSMADGPMVAISGRANILVSSQNGSIQPGDYLTASNIPGVAMKATKAGKVIGQALSGFSASGQGTVVAIINPGQFNGVNIEGVVPGLALDNSTSDSIKMLQYFVSNAPAAGSTTPLSEILADKLFGGVEVVTPKLTSQTLTVDQISPALGNNLSVSLAPTGKFIIGTSTSGIVFDAAGNANFAGTITAANATLQNLNAAHIISPDLTALTDELTAISQQASSTAYDLSNLTTAFNYYEATTTNAVSNLSDKVDTLALSLAKLASAQSGLSVDSQVVLPNGLSVNSISALGGTLNIAGDVSFIGRPYFNTDSAGFAQISAGQKRVDVVFTNPYLEQPIINASLTEQGSTSTDDSTAFENNIFNNDIRYLIVNRNAQGFTIVINKPAPQDLQFSWIALAVHNAITFSSVVPTSTPAVLGTSTPDTSATTTVDNSGSASSTPVITNSSTTPDTSTPAAVDASATPPADTSATDTQPVANSSVGP